jgi:hypothetical protein
VCPTCALEAIETDPEVCFETRVSVFAHVVPPLEVPPSEAGEDEDDVWEFQEGLWGGDHPVTFVVSVDEWLRYMSL